MDGNELWLGTVSRGHDRRPVVNGEKRRTESGTIRERAAPRGERAGARKQRRESSGER